MDAGGNIHCIVGRMSFESTQLLENIEALLQFVRAMKPSTSKGIYMRGLSISGTMSPSISVAV